jgi:hypothetical protein
MKRLINIIVLLTALACGPGIAGAWHDETHVAIAKAAGYKKWFNAAGADMIKVKAPWIENMNHMVNNPRGTIVTAQMVLDQVDQYNQPRVRTGCLYGAIVASIRNYIEAKKRGKYGEYHLAFAAHYIGDLSQPLHNTLRNDYNHKYHVKTDGMINDEVLNGLDRIRIYNIQIQSEADLTREIARIANLSMALGYKLEDEKRLLTRKEAYGQISHSASLFRAVLGYVGRDHP